MVGENKDEPMVRTYLAPGAYALTLTRPDTMIWILNHDANENSSESWSNYISSDEVLEGLDQVPGPEKWSPMYKRLVKCTPPNTIVNFELLWRDPQTKWASPASRVLQIGDSAHTFLPASGNGATQAIEDAITFASCLQLAGSKENVPEAVQAHIRYR